MHKRATPDQFVIEDDMIIHIPTGAEFTPCAESVVVWTGNIGRTLSSGDVYQYRDVLDVMRAVWNESRLVCQMV